VAASTGTSDMNRCLGAIFCQADEEGEERVIAYATTKLLKHEKNYTPFLVKIQAMVRTMNHFIRI
jgi:hypothetical protein